MSDSKIDTVIEHYCKVRFARLFNKTSNLTITRRDFKTGETAYLIRLDDETRRVSDEVLTDIRDGLTELLEKTVTFE